MRTAALVLLFSCGLNAATLEDILLLIPKVETRPAPKPLKDVLRAWAEPHFLSVREPLATAAAMNGELKRAGLLPQVGETRLAHPSGEKDYLVLITTFSVSCGSDGSAYLYQWTANQWNLVLVSESNGPQNPAASVYDPSSFLRLSEADGSGARIFTVGGANQWCSSAWHSFFYKAWLVGQGEPTLMLDRAPVSFVADDGFDIKPSSSGLTVQLVVGHPNPAKHSGLILENYV